MIGAVLAGRYSLTGLLSDGPVFSLFSAKDRVTAREVSLRMIKPPFDKEEAFKEALNEVVLKLLVIQGSHVERLFDLQEEDGQAFVVGELTRAPSLADRIRKLAPFTSPVAVAAALGVARGLDAFHKAGLAHGDVNGDNVAMMADGETKLQMGGVWQAYSASPTAGGVVLPSMAPYMAPEVSAGGMPSRVSDIYSLGILLYELLTGRKPYVGETGVATAMRHAIEETPRVRTLNSGVPVVLDEIVYKAMSKNPSDRYGSASDIYTDLRQVQDAMRFGKTLSWPLRPRDPVPNASSGPNVGAVAGSSVAPKMSAIREPEEVGKRRREERDVPVWMMMIIAGLIGMIGCIIGVYVVLNLNRPKLEIVPNLQGLSLEEARSTVEHLHLKLKVGTSAPSEKIAADRIISTQPDPGSRLPDSSLITVTVSEGGNQVDVPQLQGLTPDKAKELLATVNLTLDSNMDHMPNSKIGAGLVVSQNPQAQTHVHRNDRVHVALSSGAEGNTTTPASTSSPATGDAEKSYEYTLSVVLTDISDPVRVRIDVLDDQGTRTFYDKIGNPNDKIHQSVIAKGAKATFRIYYDGKMVKEVEKEATESSTP